MAADEDRAYVVFLSGVKVERPRELLEDEAAILGIVPDPKWSNAELMTRLDKEFWSRVVESMGVENEG